MWQKLKNFWKKILDYIKYLWKHPRTTLPAFFIAEAIFWIPFWVPALLAILISSWWWSVVGIVVAFWCGPFTPAVPLQIAFIAAVERLITKIKNKKGENNNDRRNDQ